MRRRNISPTAFTAIELLVVLLILVLLATISLTSFAGRNRQSQLAAEARKIQRLLDTARSYALSENGHFQAVIWLDRPSYWIDEIDSSGTVTRPKIVTPEPVDEGVQITDILVNSDVYRSGIVAIRFFPQGNSNDATIHLVSRGASTSAAKSSHTVKLYGPTGRSDIFDNLQP